MERRLGAAGYQPDEIERALVDLERVGLVEDGRFARELVRDQASRRLSGDRAIRMALRQKGVGTDVAEAALAEAGEEATRAEELGRRRALRLSGLTTEAAFRRLYGLLLRRGYGPGLAREASWKALREALPSDLEPPVEDP